MSRAKVLRRKEKGAPVTYNTKEKKFYKGDKVVGRKSRDYRKYVVMWVSGQVAQGKSLETVLPVESGELPNILTFMQYVNAAEEHKRIYNEAKQARFILLSERMVAAVQAYQQDPTPENQEVLKAINSARTYLEKGLQNQDTVTIEVTSVIPKGFWDKSDWRIKGKQNEETK